MKIAFIITVYKNDKLEYFKEAIESIINQDYGFENINIYLGIDGQLSNELEAYIKNGKDLFYKIVRNKENNGLAYTLNKLIDNLENEEYIFRMDSDDICKLNRVSKQINFMEKNKSIEILGGAIEEKNENGKIRMIRTYPKSNQEARNYIYKASIFAHPTVCFRKSFFDKGFRYNIKYKFSQDLELWYQALRHNIKISNLDDVILTLRVSKGFHKRRSFKKGFGEFSIYWNGIKELYGYSYRHIYPLGRLFSRLLPPFLIKIIYSKHIRRYLL